MTSAIVSIRAARKRPLRLNIIRTPLRENIVVHLVYV